jgi:hypothetical protein
VERFEHAAGQSFGVADQRAAEPGGIAEPERLIIRRYSPADVVP